MIGLKEAPVSWLVYLYNDTVAEEEHPPYAAVATIVHWAPSVCSIRGLSARSKLTFRHLRALCGYLVNEGYTVAYVERPDGHPSSPFGSLVTEGDFKGMFRTNLLIGAGRT